jgi:uncharacterized membrane protein YidH (DUF202 family)
LTAIESWRPGSQAERTSMAWVRTSLSTLVAGGAVTRVAILDGAPWATALGVAGCASCLASVLLWWRRARRTAESADVRSRLTEAAPGAVLAAVAAVCLVGVATLGLGVLAL